MTANKWNVEQIKLLPYIDNNAQFMKIQHVKQKVSFGDSETCTRAIFSRLGHNSTLRYVIHFPSL